MRQPENENFRHDGPAIALGCVAGLAAGAAFGAGVVLALDGFASDMWIFVVPHSMLAMMMMGGWTLPSLLDRGN